MIHGVLAMEKVEIFVVQVIRGFNFKIKTRQENLQLSFSFQYAQMTILYAQITILYWYHLLVFLLKIDLIYLCLVWLTPARLVVWCCVFNTPSFFFPLYMLLWPFMMWMFILHLEIFLKVEKNGAVPKYY